jgi:F0F1-type ATP synthase assembly protein I
MITRFLVIKYIITATVVVAVSEFAKANDKLGGLIAALPLVTVLALIWLYVEKQPTSKIANHAYYTFWYVIPTLPMFLLFPYLLPKIGFWPTLLGCIIFTLVVFYAYANVLKGFGIDLL